MLWLSRLSSTNPTNTVTTHDPWGAQPTMGHHVARGSQLPSSTWARALGCRPAPQKAERAKPRRMERNLVINEII